VSAPAGGDVIAMPVIVRVRLPVKVAPLASVTFSGILRPVTPELGVPVMVAAVAPLGLRVKPSRFAVVENVYGAVPPVTVMLPDEYAAPTVPPGRVVGATAVMAGFTVRLYVAVAVSWGLLLSLAVTVRLLV